MLVAGQGALLPSSQSVGLPQVLTLASTFVFMLECVSVYQKQDFPAHSSPEAMGEETWPRRQIDKYLSEHTPPHWWSMLLHDHGTRTYTEQSKTFATLTLM